MISRRRLLQGAAAATALPCALPRPALAQARSVKFTLPWLAQGTSLFTYVGRERGIFRAHGIDIEIARGNGTVSAAQTVAAGAFDFGMGVIPPLVIEICKGLPIVFLGTMDYDSTMGVGVLGDGPITEPKQLAGKKLAQVPGSADTPLFPLYAKRAGFDVKAVDIVGTDPKLLERLVMNKQVDALTSLASSSMPVMLSQGVPCRWLLYSSAGLPSYGFTIFTQPKTLANDPGLCGALCDALMESLAYVIQNPDAAADIFFKVLPEMGLNPAGRKFIEIGMSAQQYTVTKPQSREHGLLWGDPAVYEAMLDMMLEAVLPPGTKRPAVESFYTNQFAGHVTLPAAAWDAIAARGTAFSKLLA